jgi:hypothetical protein
MRYCIERLPLAVKKAPKADRHAAVQNLVDEILNGLVGNAETAEGQKRVLATYNASRRHWYLQSASESDDALCKTVLAELKRRVQAERPAEAPASTPPVAPEAN